MSWQKISIILAALVALASLIGVCFKVDSYYAHADELKSVVTRLEYTNQRLELKIVNDEIRQQTDLMWRLQDRITHNPNASSDSNIYLREVRHKLMLLEAKKKQLEAESLRLK